MNGRPVRSACIASLRSLRLSRKTGQCVPTCNCRQLQTLSRAGVVGTGSCPCLMLGSPARGGSRLLSLAEHCGSFDELPVVLMIFLCNELSGSADNISLQMAGK